MDVLINIRAVAKYTKKQLQDLAAYAVSGLKTKASLVELNLGLCAALAGIPQFNALERINRFAMGVFRPGETVD